MKYVEKKTSKGFILKVNRIQGKFTLFKNGRLIPNPSSHYNSIYYPLQRIIFIGEIFKKDFIDELDIGFFYILNRQAHISFRVADMSDIRHIKLPGNIESDMLPVSVYYFKNMNIGIYANVFKTGIPYFVLEPRFDRKYVISLKQTFPSARVVIYKPEQVPFNDLEDDFIFRKHKISENPSSEFIEKDEIGLLSQDPLFTARMLIKRKKWGEIYELPKKTGMTLEEVKPIIQYLEIQLKEHINEEAVKFEINKLIEFFETISNILFTNSKEAYQYLDNNPLNLNLISKLENTIHYIKNKSAYSNRLDPGISYYENLLLKLKEKKSAFQEQTK